MDSRGSDQFASMWRFYLARRHTLSWLCDPTPISLVHAMTHAREPPEVLSAYTDETGAQSLHTLCVLGHDGPFALGALVEGNIRQFTGQQAPMELGRTALVIDSGVQIVAVFSWLCTGALTVRFGVLGSGQCTGEKCCRWNFSRVFQPHDARAVARAGRQGVDVTLAQNMFAPTGVFRNISAPSHNAVMCARCPMRSSNGCNCRGRQNATVAGGISPRLWRAESRVPTALKGHAQSSQGPSQRATGMFLTQNFTIGEAVRTGKNQEPAKLCSEIDAALSFPELPSVPAAKSDNPDAAIPTEQIFSASAPLPADAQALLSILDCSAKTADTPVSVKDFSIPNQEASAATRRKQFIASAGMSILNSRRLPPVVPIEKKHTPVQTLQCPECGVRIRGKRGNLNRHIAARHEQSRDFSCAMPRCGLAFQSKLNLIRHMTRVHEGRPHRCSKCPRRFRSAATLSKHVRAAHSPRRAFICNVCGVCFGRCSVLESHVARVHGGNGQIESFKCTSSSCEARFTDWEERLRHEQEFHDGRVNQCPACVAVFETECELSRHIRTGHGQTKTSRSCPVCGSVYSQRSNLLRHISLAHKNYAWKDEFE